MTVAHEPLAFNWTSVVLKLSDERLWLYGKSSFNWTSVVLKHYWDAVAAVRQEAHLLIGPVWY